MQLRAWISVLALIFSTSNLSAQEILDQQVSWAIEDKSIPEALEDLSDQVGIIISYSTNFFNNGEKHSYKFRNTSFRSLLKKMLEGQNLDFRTMNDQILIYQKKRKQQVLNGYVRDKTTGEGLISAIIRCEDEERTVLSNEFGYFSLTLPLRNTRISFRYLGFEEHVETINPSSNTFKTIYLKPNAILDEVIIVPDSLSQSRNITNDQLDLLDKDLVRYNPGIGEKDYVRTLERLPGFQLANDGLGGLQVRGGDSGQNLLLMDGVPIYIPYHLLGLYSIYNASTIKTARVFKSSIPARYGGRSSSILDLWTKEGNRYEYHSEASINLTNANLMVEGPIPFLKGKSSLMVAGRYAPNGFLYQPTFKRIYFQASNNTITSSFNDLNAKLSYQISNNDQIYLSFFTGNDRFRSNEQEEEGIDEEMNEQEDSELEFSWENITGSARWNHSISSTSFLSTTLTFSDYGYKFSRLNLFGTTDPGTNQLFFLDSRSANQDFSIQSDLHLNLSAVQSIRIGGGLAHRTFNPSITYLEEEREDQAEDDLATFELVSDDQDRVIANELHLYVEDRIKFSRISQLDLGFRSTVFQNNNNYIFNLEPRISLAIWPNSTTTFSLSANRTVQHLHLINNMALRLPNDQWIPSDQDVKPQSAWHFDFTYSQGLTPNWKWQSSVYYKNMENLYNYQSDLSFDEGLNNLKPIEYLTKGQGRAYGIENSLKWNHRGGGGILTYFYGHSERKYEGYNEEAWYPFEFDHRHRFKISFYEKIRNFTLSIAGNYYSPNPRVYLSSIQSQQGLATYDPNDISSKNSSRSNAYIRLDLSIQYKITKSYGTHEIGLGIYNSTNQQNIAFYNVTFDANQNPISTPIHSLSLLPSFRYTFTY